ncbi:MAG: cupredoxin domain-containing protein [Nanoarchaeota archaeon]|nr:cupredoxin domain-containing protein [Nanoarchaeota archaeon]
MYKRAQKNLQIKKKTLFRGVGALVVVLFIYMVAGGGSESSGFTLTGQVVALDPNRPMAGSPCHFMDGQAMGDCETREIELVASQWDWSEPTITVKSGELIRIKATSKDVTHGITIPKIRFNLNINPGRTTVGEFVAPAPGEYLYGCSVMCGAGHGTHTGKLIVMG